MRPLGVIGHLSRDVVAGGEPRIGGGPWHAARALRALRHDAVVFAKCGDDDRRTFGTQLATLGLPVSLATGGDTTAFSFSYDDAGGRTMSVDAVGDPWHIDDLAQNVLRRVAWLQVAPLLHGDFDADVLAWLARDRRILFDGQGLVRVRETGPLQLDGSLDRDLLQHVSVLKLAVEEAEAVGDVTELGVPEVLVTYGAGGADVFTREGRVHVAAREVRHDPTGAGDAFSAVYAASRAEGHAPVSAARRATALVAALLSGRER